MTPTNALPRRSDDAVRRRLAALPPGLRVWAFRLGIHRTITAASLGVLPESLAGEARAAIEALAREGVLTRDENRETAWNLDRAIHRAAVQRLHDRDPRESRHSHDELVAALAAADDAGLDEDLIYHARWAARWDVLSQMWWRVGHALLLQGSDVITWAYRTLPPGIAGRHPSLALAELVVGSATDVVGTRNGRLLRAIASGSSVSLPELAQAATSEAVLATGTLHIIALCHTGDVTGANAWIDAAEAELSRRDDGFPAGARRRFQVEAAEARLLLGRILDVRHYAGAVIAESAGAADPDPSVRRARGLLALVSSILGWEGDGGELDEQLGTDAPVSIRVALAHRAADRLHRERLRRLVDGMDPQQSPPPQTPLWAFVLLARALLALLDGRPLDELPRLDLVESDRRAWLADEGFSARLLRRCRAELLLAGGEPQRASAILLTRESPAPELRVPLARLYLHTGQPHVALDYVTRVLTDPTLSPRERATFETIRAAALLILDRPDEARAATRTMFTRYPGVPPGWSVQLMLLPRELRLRLLAFAPSAAVPAGLAKRLRRLGGPAPPASSQLISLSPRERIVIAELQRGGTLAEIGDRLCVSRNTLKKQTNSIYRKLGVTSRDAAVRRAVELGLLGPR